MKDRANRSSKLGRAAPSCVGAAIVAFALLAIWAAPALAVQTHAFTGVTIGPGGKGVGGQFTVLQSVAVDPSSRDLYVLDAGNLGRLYKFDSQGEPLDFTATGTNFIEGTGGPNRSARSQVAIAPPGAAGGTAGDIYVANSEVLKIYSPAGVEIGQVTETLQFLCGVAVDATGNVFTKNEFEAAEPVVREFTPTANPLTNADESGKSPVRLPETCNLAVDGKGHIYASGPNPTPIGGQTEQELWKLPSLTANAKQLFDAHASTVAVEPGTDDVYVSHGTKIVQYAEDGSVISTFGEGNLVEAPGIGIAGPGEDIYVSARSSEGSSPPVFKGRIDVFGPLASLPKVVTEAAGEITKTSAVLHGTISADGGPAATCKFEYVTQAAFALERFVGAASAPCVPGGPFTSAAAEPVSAEIGGLGVGTEYRFRLVGQNANGSLGSDESGSAAEVAHFQTQPAFKVQTGPATNVTETSATLTGSINPEGVIISECFFEYGKTTAYGASIPCESPTGGEIGIGNAPVAVHAAIVGLIGSTEYRFRLVGGSPGFGGIKVLGGDAGLGTLGVSQILSENISQVGQTTAVVSGSINPHSASTHYFVEYLTDAVYAANVEASHEPFTGATKVPPEGVAIGSGFTGVEVDQALTGLTPGTKYHLRLFAENGLGEGKGLGKTFTTHVLSSPFGPRPV